MPAFWALISSSCCKRSVAMRPGMSVFTRIFCGASSTESVFASDVTADRRTFDSARLGNGSLTDDDVPTRMTPPPRLPIDGATSRTVRTTLISRSSIERCRCRLVEDSARRPDTGMPDGAAAPQHLLADRHADALLELEAHQRHFPVEEIGRLVGLPRAKERDDLHEDRREREARHGPG